MSKTYHFEFKTDQSEFRFSLTSEEPNDYDDMLTMSRLILITFESMKSVQTSLDTTKERDDKAEDDDYIDNLIRNILNRKDSSNE